VVCEASSFQLEDTERFSPEAAVLLNLAPDHLDRHASFEQYVAAKLKVFANQDRDDVAVAPADLGLGELPGKARRVLFGPRLPPELEPLIGLDELSLPGEHNRQNAIAAAAVCLARGLEHEAIAAGLRTFEGVAHRLELVAVRDGVSYVNDSKATNVASTVVGLRAYPDGIHLIAGGRGKRQDFAPLAPLVAERCRAAYLIGEAAGELAEALKETGVALHVVQTLEQALPLARAAAQPGEVVLFSPACASYDQYRDFEARGEHFRSLVEGA
jgi:UDP-N-acetylmuramoylalanine--D-glutamate ligase